MNKLEIHIDAESNLIQKYTEIEVRDGAMHRMSSQSTQYGAKFKLKSGAYLASVKWADGYEQEHLISINSSDVVLTFVQYGKPSEKHRTGQPEYNLASPKGFVDEKIFGFIDSEDTPTVYVHYQGETELPDVLKSATSALNELEKIQRLPSPSSGKARKLPMPSALPPLESGRGNKEAIFLEYIPYWQEGRGGKLNCQPISLLKYSGARAINQTDEDGRWAFQSTGLRSIPVASFNEPTRNEFIQVSLPLNPAGAYLPDCWFGLEAGNKQEYIASFWIAPQREAFMALFGSVSNGQLSMAKTLAHEAFETSLDEYVDPAGAMLGMLVLNRFGLISKSIHHLKKLVKDCAWLTDAKIIELSLAAKEQGASEDLLNKAIALSKEPILYTDTYSILIDLLRRWPGECDGTEGFRQLRSQALSQLAGKTVYVDWSCVILTFRSDTQLVIE